MAKQKQNAAHKSQVNEHTNLTDDAIAADYANNMFRDGNNRVAHIRDGSAYDAAAHAQETKDDAAYADGAETELLLDSNLDTLDGQDPETLLATPHDTSRSRDGTDASGSMDESGGFLGGSTQEVDALEASAAPVDKIPHMND